MLKKRQRLNIQVPNVRIYIDIFCVWGELAPSRVIGPRYEAILIRYIEVRSTFSTLPPRNQQFDTRILPLPTQLPP